MALFPKIQSPCPYKDNLASIMDGDQCRMCNRQVFEITHMSDTERKEFLAACSGEICVSYTLPLRRALAAAALAAAALSVPTAVAAQEAASAAVEEDMEIFAGGIKDPKHIEYGEDAADLAMPELPAVYEADQPGPAVLADGVTPAG